MLKNMNGPADIPESVKESGWMLRPKQFFINMHRNDVYDNENNRFLNKFAIVIIVAGILMWLLHDSHG